MHKLHEYATLKNGLNRNIQKPSYNGYFPIAVSITPRYKLIRGLRNEPDHFDIFGVDSISILYPYKMYCYICMGFLGDDNVTLHYEKEVRTTLISIKINWLHHWKGLLTIKLTMLRKCFYDIYGQTMLCALSMYSITSKLNILFRFSCNRTLRNVYNSDSQSFSFQELRVHCLT